MRAPPSSIEVTVHDYPVRARRQTGGTSTVARRPSDARTGDGRGTTMNLALSDEQELLRDTFARLFATESTPERVRDAEPLGFDAALWKTLAEIDAIGIRVPEAHGGSGAGLLEAVLLAEQAGRHLAPGPLIESIVAAQLLAR